MHRTTGTWSVAAEWRLPPPCATRLFARWRHSGGDDGTLPGEGNLQGQSDAAAEREPGEIVRTARLSGQPTIRCGVRVDDSRWFSARPAGLFRSVVWQRLCHPHRAGLPDSRASRQSNRALGCEARENTILGRPATGTLTTDCGSSPPVGLPINSRCPTRQAGRTVALFTAIPHCRFDSPCRFAFVKRSANTASSGA